MIKGKGLAFCLIIACFLTGLSARCLAARPLITELSIQGGIGPASADYLIRGIEKGQSSELILIRLDTPGGLNKSTRQIVQAILNSVVPVVTYVSPNGARAASAGTFILYASTLAVMAPGTHLGAASPVSLTAISGADKKDKPSTMDKKVKNDALAYIRALAQLRQRNVSFAEKAIADAATMTAEEALKNHVINFIANNRTELLKQLNGMEVQQQNQVITINTANAELKEIQPDWRMRFLLMITEPTVAYLLLMLGIYGIFFELFNPGVIVPGVIGAIAMLIALYALQLLPINYAGLGLLILGIAFIIAEAFAPSFGILGIGGTIAFIVGSILLIDTSHQGYQIAMSAIWAMAAVNLLFFLTIFSLVVRSRWRASMHGSAHLLGEEGKALQNIDEAGQALIHGEIWAVKAKQPIAKGRPVRVIAAKGLTLEVEEMKD